MNFIEAAIIILFIAVLAVPVANKLRMPLEIFLFLGSCLLSFTAELSAFTINPTVVLICFYLLFYFSQLILLLIENLN